MQPSVRSLKTPSIACSPNHRPKCGRWRPCHDRRQRRRQRGAVAAKIGRLSERRRKAKAARASAKVAREFLRRYAIAALDELGAIDAQILANASAFGAYQVQAAAALFAHAARERAMISHPRRISLAPAYKRCARPCCARAKRPLPHLAWRAFRSRAACLCNFRPAAIVEMFLVLMAAGRKLESQLKWLINILQQPPLFTSKTQFVGRKSCSLQTHHRLDGCSRPSRQRRTWRRKRRRRRWRRRRRRRQLDCDQRQWRNAAARHRQHDDGDGRRRRGHLRLVAAVCWTIVKRVYFHRVG